jgi:hypothetical protein
MKWPISTRGISSLIHLKPIAVFISEQARIFGTKIRVLSLPFLKRLVNNLTSILNLRGKGTAKLLKSLPQKQNAMVDRNGGTSDKERSIGFKQLLRRLGIIAAAKLEETMHETKDAIKHDIEVNTQPIDTESVPTENTLKRTQLNEDLAEQIRQQTGLDCKASEIGSLEVEHKRYYSNNFPMSPKITTNRGCIIVNGRRFSIIHIIQRN